MKVALITASLGGIDSDKRDEHVPQTVQHDFYYVDDTILTPRSVMHPRLQAKIPKMLGWRMFPGYDVYVWMDASFQITDANFLAWIIGSMGDNDIALFPHAEGRTNIKEECIHVVSNIVQDNEFGQYLRERYDSEPVVEQTAFYLSNDEYKDENLFCGGLFVYRNTMSIQAMLQEWFMHNIMFTIEDQLSLPYVLTHAPCKVTLIRDNCYHNQYVTRKAHL